VSKHDEFPELTQQTQAAYRAGCRAGQFSPTPLTSFDRRYLAAFLREAMKQATDHVPNGWETAFLWDDLQAIASNLHSLPTLPTLAQAQAADLDTPEGRDVVRAFLATLGQGEQP
jgi:hypothetical protein